MWRVTLPAIILTTVGGCGKGAKLSGKVHFQGRPVLSGYVTVLNGDGTAVSGVIQPDGTYSVDGVQRGKAKIGLASPDPARARSIIKKPKTKDGPARTAPGTDGWYPLPAHLADPQKSGIEVEIGDSIVPFDIAIK
jgi:hypothetical protein